MSYTVSHPVEETKMVWYYVKDGSRQGPVEEAEMNRLVAQSIVRPDTLVWRDGMPDWQAYSAVAPAAPAPSPVVEAPVQPVSQPVYQPSAEPVVYARSEAAAPSPAQVQYQAQAQSQTQAQAQAGPAQAGPAAGVAAAVPSYFCTQCGRQYPSDELVRFGTATVCANCKEIYAQRLRETGQVAGARVYGGFWIRFLAVVIDMIALWIVNFAIQTLTGTRISSPANFGLMLSTLGINMVISTAIAVFYESFFLVKYGATPGKMVLRLKVITPDGGPISWGRAIGRYFAKILSGVTLMIGYIMAGFDSEKRALHDYIAGTRVIRTA